MGPSKPAAVPRTPTASSGKVRALSQDMGTAVKKAKSKAKKPSKVSPKQAMSPVKRTPTKGKAMSPAKGMGPVKVAVAGKTSGRKTAPKQKLAVRKTPAKPKRAQKVVPPNPTHGHHPQASHLWHQIAGAKTKYKVLRPGYKDASYIKGGDTVTMHATGKVQDTGKQFWSTKDVGHKAFTYVQGAGVIRAWDSGTRGMRVGERRQLIIPAEEAYGADGFTHWDIPPKKDLEFELEVMKIKSKHARMEL